MECLGDILRSAMKLPHSPEEVSEQIRWRLRDVETKTPLQDVDYYKATGVSYKLNDDREKVFLKCVSVLDSHTTSGRRKKMGEDTLQKLFSFY
jgi:hypothetical protein